MSKIDLDQLERLIEADRKAHDGNADQHADRLKAFLYEDANLILQELRASRESNEEMFHNLAGAGRRITELREALEEITKGDGAFSVDPATHAGNCIENIKEIAQTALDGLAVKPK